MRLSEIWDYFMRRKWLLLSVIIVSATIVFLGCKLCFGETSEFAETATSEATEVAKIEVPRTGEATEVIEIAQAEAGCDAGVVDWPENMLGNGENTIEEITDLELGSGITFWGAEAPVAAFKTEEPDTKSGETVETVIVTLGILTEIVVLGVGKMFFDRYAR